EGPIRAVTGEAIRLGTIGRLTFPKPSIYGPDVSWAGLSRVLQAALDGDAAAFAFPAGVPQGGLQGRAANGCMDYVPQVHTWEQMRQRIELGKQLAPHLQGA